VLKQEIVANLPLGRKTLKHTCCLFDASPKPPVTATGKAESLKAGADAVGISITRGVPRREAKKRQREEPRCGYHGCDADTMDVTDVMLIDAMDACETDSKI